MSTKINLDTSQRVDITCRKGDTFSLRLTITDSSTPPVVGFSDGDTFLMEVRDSDTGLLVANTANPVVNFQVEVEVDDSDSSNPADTDTGTVDFTLSATTMKTMPSGLYVYDIEHETSSGVIATLIYGTLKVNEDVSETLGS